MAAAASVFMAEKPAKIVPRFNNPPRSSSFSRKAERVPVFAGRTIRGVKNGPSPASLQQRLKAVAAPDLALVDTPTSSRSIARPLHVYDADKLKGEIRPPAEGRKVSPSTADLRARRRDVRHCRRLRRLGLGGVMGGRSTAW
jgi:phenylalanyl-tRNA synthetase beta chain